ncbi:MAG: NAD-dependent epimerase/dehydratase family protein [Chlorobiaceae bacterium]|nr:NAD-dependent epimerase/dehydratase family protein [Chlorobiaceae bacterium]
MEDSNLIRDDLDQIVSDTETLWSSLRGERLFITGGTGFFGKWFLESFIRANERLGLNAQAVVLTRNPESFCREMPRIAANSAIGLHVGDIREFSYPDGEFSHIIHASTTSAVATYNHERPVDKFTTIVHGAQRVCEFASRCGCRNMLLTSSGSAYGSQPENLPFMPESYTGAPLVTTPEASALGESKRISELLACMYGEQYSFEVKIARCFSFVGPYLQLDIHYAIGNFIQAALAGRPLVVHGDGTPLRSYQYTADLMTWLWTIMFKGESRRLFNVGSMDAISIGDLAHLVADCAGNRSEVHIEGVPVRGQMLNSYIPDTRRAEEELGLRQRVGLREAIMKTMEFYGEYIAS